jgi:hypothetical protein
VLESIACGSNKQFLICKGLRLRKTLGDSLCALVDLLGESRRVCPRFPVIGGRTSDGCLAIANWWAVSTRKSVFGLEAKQYLRVEGLVEATFKMSLAIFSVNLL